MHVNKPWGWYKDLKRTPQLVVKQLYVKPFSRFSLQRHFKREEAWYIVSGIGKVTIDQMIYTIGPGDTYIVKPGQVHRLEAYADGVEFVEVQRGECFEDDIERLEDDFGRTI
tara:strand:+ start:669 stop:1004 length:336 start_codon:yes stop_codon:yes gene_type:complete